VQASPVILAPRLRSCLNAPFGERGFGVFRM